MHPNAKLTIRRPLIGAIHELYECCAIEPVGVRASSRLLRRAREAIRRGPTKKSKKPNHEFGRFTAWRRASAELSDELNPGGKSTNMASAPLRICRVLIVDDNHDSADTVARLLGFFGHEVRIVYNGDACLDAVEAFRPDAILLDLDMPDMSGFEVASRLRQNPGKYGSALLVALTGRTGDNRDRRIAKEIGFDDYLVKPANPEQLRRVVSASLDREEG